MIRIVYTNAVCEKYQGACQKGSHDECELECRYELDREKVPAFEGVADYYQVTTAGYDIKGWETVSSEG